VVVDVYNINLRKIKKNEALSFIKYVRVSSKIGAFGYQRVNIKLIKTYNSPPEFEEDPPKL
jgi:hypothetical protein